MDEEKDLPSYDGQFDLFTAAEQLRREGNPYKRTKTGGTEVARGTSFGESTFDEDFFPNISMNWDGSGSNIEETIGENRAQKQPWIAKASAGVARVGVKVAAEIAKMPGVIGGVALGAAGQAKDGITGEDKTNFMQTAFNNAWIKGINESNEKLNDEILPVYVKKAVKEGDIWDNLTAVDFWATEGADGLGYIISMLAPGQAIHALKFGAGLTKAGAKVGRGVGKYAGMSSKVDNALNKLSSVGVNAKNVDLHTSTIANTLFEAGAEAQGAMEAFIADPANKEALDNRANKIYEKLVADYEKNGYGVEGGESIDGEMSGGAIPSEEEILNQLKEKATEQAGKELSAEVGRDVFLFNAGILVGPNAIMSKIIWGGKNTGRAAANIARSNGDNALTKVADPTIGQKIGKVAEDLGAGALREGFFEEGMQSTVEGYVSDTYSKGGDWSDYTLGDLGNAYVETVQTTEGQKAIALGAFFGGGMQSYQGAKHRKQEREATNELISLANEEFKKGYNTLNEDIYSKDKDGNVIYTTNKEGKKVPRVDTKKFVERLQSTDKVEQLSFQYDMAVENGNKEQVEMIRNIVATDMIVPFILDEKLGLEVLKKHLESSEDIANVAEREGVKKESIVEDFMNKAKAMEKAQSTFNNYSREVLDVSHPDAKDEDYDKFYNRLNSIYLSGKAQQHYLQGKMLELDKELNDLLAEKGVDRESFDSNGAMQNQFISTDTRVERVVNSTKEHKKALTSVDKQLNKFWSKGETDKKFKQFVGESKKIEDAEEDAPKAEKAITDINKAKDPEEVKAIAKGRQEQYEKEEALVKEIADSVNAVPTLENMKKNLAKIKDAKLSEYSATEVIEAIERGIENRVKGQQEFKKYLETLTKQLTEGIDDTKNTISEVESTIKSHKARRKKIVKSLESEDKSPKGRNAKLIKQLIAETEKEIASIDKAINFLENRKDKLQKELDDIDNQLGDLLKASDYILERYGEIEAHDFNSVKDVVEFINEAKENVKDEHRFDLERLTTHKFYTQQNVDALTEIIEKLSQYRDYLQNKLHPKLKEGEKSNVDNVQKLTKELKKSEAELAKLEKEFKAETAKLDRLDKALESRELLHALTEELQFWENLQKTKLKNRPPNYLNNPIVDKASIDKQKELERKRQEEEDRKAEEAELARKLSDDMAEAQGDQALDKEFYVNYLRDNFNIGEQVPMPPEVVKVPGNIRDKEEDHSYFLHTVSDKGVTLKIDGSTFFVSSEGVKSEAGVSTTEPSETGGKPEATKPLYNTEGGTAQDVIEEGDNLPKDKEGNVIDETLDTIENDARVITGTDKGAKLDFVPQAAVDFERTPKNKKNETVHFEINKEYTEGKQGEALKLLNKEKHTPEDIEFLINHLPLNILLNKDIPDAKAPLETLNENPNLDKKARDEYNSVFNKSSKHLRTAIIKEVVLNGTPIESITTTIAGQKPGSIQVAPKKNGKVQENSILNLHEVGGKMSKIKASDIYVVNDQGRLENYKGDFFGTRKRLHPGEVYYVIHTANGKPFPLKLNIKKVTTQEAELLYEIYKHRFEVGTEKGKSQLIKDTNETVINLVKKTFSKELAKGGLFDRNSKPLEDLSIKDVVDFLIWDGTKSKKSQIRFDTKHLKVMNLGTLSKEEFMESKEDFIEALTSTEQAKGKRRNISFKKKADQESTAFNFENRSYLEYLIENKILNTNALADETYPPTFQGDTTIYLKTNNVRVSKGPDVTLSDFNVAKAITKVNTLRGSKGSLKTKQPGLFSKRIRLNETQTNLYRKREVDPKTGKPHEFKSKLVSLTPRQEEHLSAEEKKLHTKIPTNHYYDDFGNYYQRVSHITAETEQDLSAARFYNAAKRGDVVDALIRDYFSRGYKDMDEFVKDGKKKLNQVNKERTKHGDIHITPNAFRELFHVMQEYEIEFQKRGYTVYSTTEALWGNLKKKGRIVRAAGSMDLLVQDKRGRFIIIDIKTSTVDRAADYASDRSMYKEKDRKQQNAYRELFTQRTKVPIHKILIMPITITAKKDEGKANSVYRNITRTSEASGFLEVDMSENIFEIMGETPISSEDKSIPGKHKTKKKAQTGFGNKLKEMDNAPEGPEWMEASGLEQLEAGLESGMPSVAGLPVEEYSSLMAEYLDSGMSYEEAESEIKKAGAKKKTTKKSAVVGRDQYPSSLTPAQGTIYAAIKKEIEKESFSADENIAALNNALEQTTGENVEAKNTRKAISKLIEEYKASKKESSPIKKPTITKKEVKEEKFDEKAVEYAYNQLKINFKFDNRSDEAKIKDLKDWLKGTVDPAQQEAIRRVITELQGISKEEIRKSKEDSVSLQKMTGMIREIDTSKLSDAKAKTFIADIVRTPSLRGLGRDIRTINKEEGSNQERLEKILQLLADKAESNEDVKTICRNIKNS